ncbi:F-box containing protein [Brazilian marseillevirus]|uniref:F-box containing protein n=1 Tax=Brazilian marseillevirus TaxID=1813599 RepID=UPI0007802C00|nr:F-box containing protein [Brazilian marseillevirus]AMQ10545.1 F-box containing protein [Brazilian marseillevirus]
MEFQEFPLEIVSHIISFLPLIKHINSFAQTCSVYYGLVRSSDILLVRKEYRLRKTNKNGQKKATGYFHITPAKVRHGTAFLSFNRNATIRTYDRGARIGFEMTVLDNGDLETGSYKNGKRFGLWKKDSQEFREDWNGPSHRVLYDETGMLHSHSKDRKHIELITKVQGSNIIYYREKNLAEEFHFENTDRNYSVGFEKMVYNKKFGKMNATGAVFFHCCDEQQGRYASDLLYFEEPEPQSAWGLREL